MNVSLGRDLIKSEYTVADKVLTYLYYGGCVYSVSGGAAERDKDYRSARDVPVLISATIQFPLFVLIAFYRVNYSGGCATDDVH